VVKEWAIQLFGTSDKLLLTVVVLVTIGIEPRVDFPPGGADAFGEHDLRPC
jgi:hypothetical protein